jgi:hypothetical protein
MTRTVSLATLLSWLLAMSVAAAQGVDPKNVQKEVEKQKEKLKRGGTWPGRIVDLDEDKKFFILEVVLRIPYQRVTPTGFDKYGRPTGVLIETGVQRVTDRAKVWLPANVKVRLPWEPDLDDKGRPVAGTPKGNPKDPDRNLGGVAGDMEALKKDQVVQVTLERNRAGHLFAQTIQVLGDKGTP